MTPPIAAGTASMSPRLRSSTFCPWKSPGAWKNTLRTGIAGPDGGTTEKPVGTVVIGIKINDKIVIETFLLRGDRNKIRERACMSALNMFLKELKKIN